MTLPSTPIGDFNDKFRAEFNRPQLVLVDQLAQELGLTRNAATLRAVEAAAALYGSRRGRRFVLSNGKSRRMREIELDPTILFSRDAEQTRAEILRNRRLPIGEPSAWIDFWIGLTPQVAASEFWRTHGENAPARAVWIASEVTRIRGDAGGSSWEPCYVGPDGFEAIEFELSHGLLEPEAQQRMDEVLLWFDARDDRVETWRELYNIFSSRSLGIDSKLRFARALHRMKLSARENIREILQVSCVDAQDMDAMAFDQLTWSVGLDQTQHGDDR